MSDYKPTIAVDFDGVIHSYISGWRDAHVIPDLPVEGAIEWLDGLLLRFHVVIVSTRARTWRGRRAIRRWLRVHCKNAWLEHWTHPGFESIQVTAKKVPALVYIDDRAMRFEGEFPSTAELEEAAIPWTKRRGIPTAAQPAKDAGRVEPAAPIDVNHRRIAVNMLHRIIEAAAGKDLPNYNDVEKIIDAIIYAAQEGAT